MFVTLLPALLVSLGLQPNEDRAREFVNSISVTQAEQLYGILVDENFGNKLGFCDKTVSYFLYWTDKTVVNK